MARLLILVGSILVLAPGLASPQGWPHFGGDAGGQRYSPLTQISAANVDQLEIAWVHHSGDLSDGSGDTPSRSSYELTPIYVDQTLYGCSPMNRVFALDPETGEQRWSFDPEIDRSVRYANDLICRGVSYWRDPAQKAGTTCAARIFTGTNDARLFALDARTGKPCRDFGQGGELPLTRGVGVLRGPGEYQVTSPPAIFGDLVIVGSAISDNRRTDAPSGSVRAFDARSGALVWAWDPVPEDFEAKMRAPGSGYALGTANVWATMSVDEERDLLLLPTGNTAPDYFGGHRGRLEEYASSVVALRASTGEPLWHFQTVHHDLWDFDVPAQPALFELRRGQEVIPALVQPTKMGHVFVLDRRTGEPLFPVEERPVPQGGVPGEKLSPTQPFPVKPPSLVRQSLSPEEAWGLTFWDRGRCRARIESLRFDGMFTPPGLEPTMMLPGNAGGANWGGVAIDPERQLLIANTSDIPWVVTLMPSAEFAAARRANPGVEISPQEGTPYAMRRELLTSPLGLPCNPPPWGQLAAVDLVEGKIVWQVPLGTPRDISPIPVTFGWGTPNIGGPLVTAGGLVFIGAAMDDYLRAFDETSGAELWKGRLPGGGQAGPMTYRGPDTRQYVVIAAGGHGRMETTLGDSLVAFRLPQALAAAGSSDIR